MKIEEFSLGNSWIHRLDPRVKIVAASIFSVVVAVHNSVVAGGLGLMFAVLLTLAARIPIRRLLARIAVVNGFIVFLWVLLPFTSGGSVVYSVGPVDVYREGLATSFLITLKSNAIMVALVALLGTSPLFALIQGLGRLGMPDKLVHMLFFSTRYIHVIHEEYHRLGRAAKIRGFKAKTSMHTYRTYAYFVAMLLIRSFDRSGRVLDAMKCRGFKGHFFALDQYEMKKSDYVAAGAGLACSLVLLVV